MKDAFVTCWHLKYAWWTGPGRPLTSERLTTKLRRRQDRGSVAPAYSLQYDKAHQFSGRTSARTHRDGWCGPPRTRLWGIQMRVRTGLIFVCSAVVLGPSTSSAQPNDVASAVAKSLWTAEVIRTA